MFEFKHIQRIGERGEGFAFAFPKKDRKTIRKAIKDMWNKYGAKKTTVNGITFDSGAEARYYKKLLEQKRAGEIKDFDLQPKFLLQPAFKKNSKTIRSINYIADFKVYHLDGSISIVDVKGVETETFNIKRKLFEERYPELSLQIVKEGSSNANKRKRKPQTAEEKEKAKQRAERKAKSRARRGLRKRV